MRGQLPLRDYSQPYRGQILAPEPYPTRTLDQIIWLVVHHEGSADTLSTIQQVADYQIGPTAQAPFPGFAYTGYILADGTIIIAWSIEKATWSQGDNSPSEINGVGIYNYQGIAFCLAGCNATDQQVASLKRIKRAVETIVTRPVTVRGHRDVDGVSDTECPGDVTESRIPEIQAA